jgi:hypothetical protein
MKLEMKQRFQNPAKLAKFFCITGLHAGIIAAHGNNICFAEGNESIAVGVFGHLGFSILSQPGWMTHPEAISKGPQLAIKIDGSSSNAG